MLDSAKFYLFQTYNWNTCKIANLRDDAVLGERARLGRKPKDSTPTSSESPPTDVVSRSDKAPDSTVVSKQTRRRGRPRGREKERAQPNAVSPSPKQIRPLTEGGKIQTEIPQISNKTTATPSEDDMCPVHPNWSPRPGPSNCNFGPVITRKMYDQWDSVVSPRPVRSTRNPRPNYVDSVTPA